MAEHLKRDLGNLKNLLLEVGGRVEESVQKAIIAFERKDASMAAEVVDGDRVIDDAEVEIEEQCLKSLALHQPFAQDLRFITGVMKINNDLERMGDCAANIARRVKDLPKESEIAIPDELDRMAKLTLTMVRDSLNAFINKDPESALDVCKRDDQVDKYNRKVSELIREQMRKDPSVIDHGLDVLNTAKRIERIADLSTNIAEDVVYISEGAIIRHSRDI